MSVAGKLGKTDVVILVRRGNYDGRRRGDERPIIVFKEKCLALKGIHPEPVAPAGGAELFEPVVKWNGFREVGITVLVKVEGSAVLLYDAGADPEEDGQGSSRGGDGGGGVRLSRLVRHWEENYRWMCGPRVIRYSYPLKELLYLRLVAIT